DLARDRVRERRERAAMVHRGLRAFRLDLVENLRELADLRLFELQLVGEESQRPANSESAASETERARLFFARHAVRPGAPPFATLARLPGRSGAALAASLPLPMGNESGIHETSSRRGHRSRRVPRSVGEMPHAVAAG